MVPEVSRWVSFALSLNVKEKQKAMARNKTTEKEEITLRSGVVRQTGKRLREEKRDKRPQMKLSLPIELLMYLSTDGAGKAYKSC